MQNKNWVTPVLLGITVVLGAAAIIIAQRLFALRQESISPTAPESKPKAVEEPTPVPGCRLSFSLEEGPTVTPGPSATPTPTPPPGATNTPTPGPTSALPSCDSSCDVNNNRCPSDAPYCVDYSTDTLGPVCGRQTLAGEGSQCQTQAVEGPSPTSIPLPPAGIIDNTIWAIVGGAAFILLGLLFL